MLAGQVTCGDCHDPHKGDAIRGGGAALASSTETCLKCHTQQAGPFTYPHGAIREEGCTACHNPHGTVNDKMLVARDANLCLRCHLAELSPGFNLGGYKSRRHPRQRRRLPAVGRHLLVRGLPRGRPRLQRERFPAPLTHSGIHHHGYEPLPPAALRRPDLRRRGPRPPRGQDVCRRHRRRRPTPSRSFDNYIKISGLAPSISGDTRRVRDPHGHALDRRRRHRGSRPTPRTSPTDTTMTVNGHALGGSDDYLANLKLTTNDVGSIDAGYKRFRTFYDGVGGFFPLADTFQTLSAEQLHVDRGSFWFNATLAKPDRAGLHPELPRRHPDRRRRIPPSGARSSIRTRWS